MRWNSFNLISPAIDRTKKRLVPFKFWEWFKLFIISLLAGSRKGGNFNFSNSGNSWNTGDAGNFREFSQAFRNSIKKYWGLGAIIFIFIFGLMTLLSYIQSVFSFIFIDSLVGKKAKFKFRKNNSKGVSLFLFKFFISVVTLIIIFILASPYIYNFMKAKPVIASAGAGYVIFSILIFVVYLIILWILFLFLYDFAVPYMYSNNTPAWFSLKKIWKNIKKNKFETFLYWLSRLVLSIAIGIISIIIIVILLLIFIIFGGLIFLIGFLLYKLTGALALLIVLGILIGILLVIIFIIAAGMILLPLGVFMKYFQLLNFERLTKIKILKKLKKRN